MKRFFERNPALLGVAGLVLLSGITVVALQYDKLPFLTGTKSYEAYVAEAGGLKVGSQVQVAGLRVGEVTEVTLDRARVRVTFTVDKSIGLGERTEAAVKTKSLLGAKVIEITSRGDGALSGPIPLERTTAAYQLPDALGDLTTTIEGLDTASLSDSLQVLAQTFADTPPALRVAVDGVARLSQTIDKRDAQLRVLLQNANKVSSVLAQRSDQVVSLVHDTTAILAQLRSQSRALDQLSASISAVSQQISGLVEDNRATLRPAVDRLNGVLQIVDTRKEKVQESLRLINPYIMSLGESISSGPFFNAYIANLLPGQFIQPFIDAAFSDLGLDPSVKLPSELVDPPTGQPGTPPLPVPYPRTGQGGEPNLTLPDAITGKPDDPRYPYREPLPGPPPGGPPPGPPALVAPGFGSVPGPIPSPVMAPGSAQVVPAQEGQ